MRAWANGRRFQNRVPNSVHTSSLHHIIDQAFPIFQRATLKNTGRPGYEASYRYTIARWSHVAIYIRLLYTYTKSVAGSLLLVHIVF